MKLKPNKAQHEVAIEQVIVDKLRFVSYSYVTWYGFLCAMLCDPVLTFPWIFLHSRFHSVRPKKNPPKRKTPLQKIRLQFQSLKSKYFTQYLPPT